jgi:4-amino-4-deoxy-L-arabinose transferase-like glycosyltransferase
MKKPVDPALLVSDGRVQVCFLAFLSAVAFFLRLNLNGLAAFDDAYYSEKAKEILKTGHWIVQTYNYGLSLTNAPLFQDLQALSYKCFGVGVFGAKFPSALAGFLTVFLVYFLGRSLSGPWTGFFGAFILATTYPFLHYARHAMQDVTETFFVTTAMAFLLLAARRDRRYFWFWGLSVGLAIAVKSIMGFFPGIMAVLFLALTKRWKAFIDPHFLGGAALSMVLTAAWVWPMYSAAPAQFMSEHVGYLILGKVQGGAPETWYGHLGFLADLAVYYWPWLPFLLYGTFRFSRDRSTDRDTKIFLWVWVLTPFLIISATKCSFLWYYMQLFPPLALLSAAGLLGFSGGKGRAAFAKALMAVGLAAAVVLIVLPIPLDRDRERDTRCMAPYVKYFGGQGARISALREGYYGLNNVLLFFSDHAADPVYDNVRDLAEAFGSKDLSLCIVHQRDMPEIRAQVREWYPVKYGFDMILIANQKVDPTKVQEW